MTAHGISIADAFGFDADVQAAVLTALGAIPGVAVHSVESQDSDADGATMRISLTGWSPSLHAVDIDATVEVAALTPADNPVRVGPDEALEAIGWLVARQRRRFEAAFALGRATPLPPEGDPTATARRSPGGRSACVRHLLLDRAMGPIAAQDGYDLAAELPAEIGSLHRFPDQSFGGPTLANSTCFVAETSAGRVAGRMLAIDTAAVPCSFDGHWVRIACDPLPEAVLAQLTGRTVAAVMPVHPVLDGRTIAEAEIDENEGGVALLLVPDHAPFDEVAGDSAAASPPEGVHVTSYASGGVAWDAGALA